MRILILGATGMLGHVLFTELSKDPKLEVWATTRSAEDLESFFSVSEQRRIYRGVDVGSFDSVMRVFAEVQADVVINCVGIIKQLPASEDPLTAIDVNSLIPHRLAMLAQATKARFLHISTDCVFDGKKGMYSEKDPANAEDLYGRTKYLGEVSYPNCITLRTSIIGHELKTNFSLIDWFLSQNSTVKGYREAIYSGFPTIEIVHIIRDFVLPNPELYGLFHVSSSPISKYELLKIVKTAYNKNVDLLPDDGVVINRSLDCSRFMNATGYQPPEWTEMVASMSSHFFSSPVYRNKPLRKENV